jgi:hypothetical protein
LSLRDEDGECGDRLHVSGANADIRLVLRATRLDQRMEMVDVVTDPKVHDDPRHAPDDWTLPAFA